MNKRPPLYCALLAFFYLSLPSSAWPQPPTRRTSSRLAKNPTFLVKSTKPLLAVPPKQDNLSSPRDLSGYGIAGWIVGISGFIILNSGNSCWPSILVNVSRPNLNFVHAMSGMLFSGSIITTTVLEWIVVRSRDKSVAPFWFEQAPGVERLLVLPALTGSILSGFGLAFQTYGSVHYAPPHVKSTLHLLALFGIWWGLTDRTTQAFAFEASKTELNSNGSLPPVMIQRRISNIVSCVFVITLYAVMVLKPG